MNKADRQRQIVELVVEEGEVSTGDLCERFDVSEMTIRRDLRELDKEGVLRRVFGGAVSNLGRSYEPPWQIRSSRNLSAKEAIGRAAAGMIFDGDSVAFDVGTTTIEIVRALDDRHGLTILTSSLPIANEIVGKFSLDSEIRLILTGGILRPTELSMIGHIPQQVYAELHVDKAFVGIGGISLEDGLTEYNLEDAQVKKALIASADETIVVADGTKIGRTTFASVASLAVISTLITDESAPPELLEQLRQREIQVIVADQEP
jgi:DeoR/GlpR family transcriptional regulator of sugar metabolism